MKSKLKFIVPLVILVLLGGVYKEVLAKTPPPKTHLHGTVYVLQKDFMLNLADNHFCKLDVALVLAPSVTLPSAESGGTPPDGYGALPQEAAVRDVITNVITGETSRSLIDRASREKIKNEILKLINKDTDVQVTDVLFTDVTVQ